ncbi:DUF6808 domain-containing protein [Hymenobacter siberiensis]|uniref:DUF6808 domain-containing protein n=1 Tax=Hymenobacter siberiensis TaxID=2848396 RepID=UPI001C1E79B1|nr:hypothetical protein [Hymenobacter siberiensis]
MTKFLVFIGLTVLLLFGLKTCGPMPHQPAKQPLSWVAPGEQSTDTIIKTVIKERIVIRNHYLTRVVSDADNKPKYHLETPDLVVDAKCDSVGLMIDSLSLTNTKSILVTDDNKGGAQVSVQNTSPYFETANVEGLYVRPKQYPRITTGIQAGVGITPVGVQQYLGIGINFSLTKRR